MPLDPDDFFSPVVIDGREFLVGDVISALDRVGYTTIRRDRLRYLSWTQDLTAWPSHPPVEKMFERGAGLLGLDMLKKGLIVTNEVGPVGCSSFDLPPSMAPFERVQMQRHYLTMNALAFMPSPEKKKEG